MKPQIYVHAFNHFFVNSLHPISTIKWALMCDVEVVVVWQKGCFAQTCVPRIVYPQTLDGQHLMRHFILKHS